MKFEDMTAHEKAEKTYRDLKKRKAERNKAKQIEFSRAMSESVRRCSRNTCKPKQKKWDFN